MSWNLPVIPTRCLTHATSISSKLTFQPLHSSTTVFVNTEKNGWLSYLVYMLFACPAGERRIYNGVSRAQYCLARCTDAISEFIQGSQGHRVILLDYRGTNFVYSLYVNLQWFILNGLKQKYEYAAIVSNPSVQLHKHALANVQICSYFICNDYHVLQSFPSPRKNLLLHTLSCHGTIYFSPMVMSSLRLITDYFGFFRYITFVMHLDIH
jgi:hypothetical protein